MTWKGGAGGAAHHKEVSHAANKLASFYHGMDLLENCNINDASNF